jgi:hypothetical protein
MAHSATYASVRGLLRHHGTPIINLVRWSTYARAHYGTSYMGTDGRRNDANSPIDPWRHGHEGGAERGDRMDHLPA